jgi:hypothetical protein
LVLIPLAGLVFAIISLFSGSIFGFLGAIIGTAIYLVFWRLIMEVYIVLFKAVDLLTEIRDTVKK